VSDLRAARAAENENLFRRINERVEELSRSLETLTIVCECSDVGCVERIPGVPIAEYEAVRSHAERFFVVEGHQRDDIESVLEERAGYLVVAKEGVGREVAEEGDPRSE
jgi:hypothetical protein